MKGRKNESPGGFARGGEIFFKALIWRSFMLEFGSI